MPVAGMCFSYPQRGENRGATRLASPGLRQMPYPCYSYPQMCFSYPGYEPRGGGDLGTARPPATGLRRMPLTCFRY